MRDRLACWLWCATLSGHPSRLHDPSGLARDGGELSDCVALQPFPTL